MEVKADAKVICVPTGKTWDIHQDIVCSWSSYLASALRESTESPPVCKVFDFGNHEIGSMIQFMYRAGCGYSSLDWDMDLDIKMESKLSDEHSYYVALWFHQLKVARLASLFKIPRLEDMALRAFNTMTNESWHPRIFFEVVTQCSKATYPAKVRTSMADLASQHVGSLSKVKAFNSPGFANSMGGEIFSACIAAQRAKATTPQVESKTAGGLSSSRGEPNATDSPRVASNAADGPPPLQVQPGVPRRPFVSSRSLPRESAGSSSRRRNQREAWEIRDLREAFELIHQEGFAVKRIVLGTEKLPKGKGKGKGKSRWSLQF